MSSMLKKSDTFWNTRSTVISLKFRKIRSAPRVLINTINVRNLMKYLIILPNFSPSLKNRNFPLRITFDGLRLFIVVEKSIEVNIKFRSIFENVFYFCTLPKQWKHSKRTIQLKITRSYCSFYISSFYYFYGLLRRRDKDLRQPLNVSHFLVVLL